MRLSGVWNPDAPLISSLGYACSDGALCSKSQGRAQASGECRLTCAAVVSW